MYLVCVLKMLYSTVINSNIGFINKVAKGKKVNMTNLQLKVLLCKIYCNFILSGTMLIVFKYNILSYILFYVLRFYSSLL